VPHKLITLRSYSLATKLRQDDALLLLLPGVPKMVAENTNMWGGFTADVFTPFIELDYLSGDSLDASPSAEAARDPSAAGTAPDKRPAGNKGDARELRMKQVGPMLERLLPLYILVKGCSLQPGGLRPSMPCPPSEVLQPGSGGGVPPCDAWLSDLSVWPRCPRVDTRCDSMPSRAGPLVHYTTATSQGVLGLFLSVWCCAARDSRRRSKIATQATRRALLMSFLHDALVHLGLSVQPQYTTLRCATLMCRKLMLHFH
jgi:hypothetical protein